MVKIKQNRYFRLHLDYQAKILNNEFDDISVFICAHKQFDDSLFPVNDCYTILANCDSFESKLHNVINISKEDISQRYKKFWCEICQFHYLYEHQDLLKDYVLVTHYRRFIKKYHFHEELIKEDVQKYNVVYTEPWKVYFRTQYHYLLRQLGQEPVNTLMHIINDYENKEYVKAFKSIMKGTDLLQCSIFCCKKEDFIEMCEIVFTILNRYSEYYEIHSDHDISHKENLKKIFNGFSNRIGGYFSEYLTMAYFVYKYGYYNIPKEILFNGRKNKLDKFLRKHPISEMYKNIEIE